MKEQIKKLRLEIDGLAQLCEGLKPIKDGLAMHRALGPLSTTSILETSPERLEEMKKEYRKSYIEVDKATSKNTEEIKEAIKSLKLSKAWLGKVLESLGSENPYGSGYKTVEDIVPETDKATSPKVGCSFEINWSSRSHIGKVDWLRTEIKQITEKCDNVIGNIDTGIVGIHKGDFIIQCDRFILQHLTEARFWLGFEMGRIRDESK